MGEPQAAYVARLANGAAENAMFMRPGDVVDHPSNKEPGMGAPAFPNGAGYGSGTLEESERKLQEVLRAAGVDGMGQPAPVGASADNPFGAGDNPFDVPGT